MPNLIGGIVLGYIWSMIFDGFLVAYGQSVVLNLSLIHILASSSRSARPRRSLTARPTCLWRALSARPR